MPAFWGVVRSLPQREKFAAERVEALGFPVFLPLVQTKHAALPLFSGYFFCLIREQWMAINRCFGVLCLVRVGDCPARCPEHEILALKSRLGPDGFIHLPAKPKPQRRVFAKGERVKVMAGGARFDALHTGMRKRDRELVLIEVLGSRRMIEVSSQLVEAAQ
jgi:transcription antitermination factor NusG